MPRDNAQPPLSPAQRRTQERFVRGMQRAYPALNPDEIRALIAQWRSMAEGQSFQLSAAFTKCANDLERLLL